MCILNWFRFPFGFRLGPTKLPESLTYDEHPSSRYLYLWIHCSGFYFQFSCPVISTNSKLISTPRPICCRTAHILVIFSGLSLINFAFLIKNVSCLRKVLLSMKVVFVESNAASKITSWEITKD